MSEKPTYAIEKYQGTVEQNMRVTTETLSLYLIGNHRVRQKDVPFDFHLDLGFATPVMQKLLESQKLGYVVDDAVREKVTKPLEFSQNVHPIYRNMMEFLHAQEVKKAEEQSLVERSSIIYYDLENKKFFVTKPKFGNYASAETEITEVIDEGNITLFPVHTHPIDSLPSPADYGMLILNIFDEEVGYKAAYANATLIVGPTLQVFAVATPQTPILPVEDVQAMREYWKNQLQGDDERLARIDKKRTRMLLNDIRAGINASNKHQYFKEICNRRVSKGGMTPEEAQAAIDEYREKSLRKLERKIIPSRKRRQSLDRRYKDIAEHMNVSLLMQCARALNLEMYISDNMKDFWKFSA